eukprot:s2597_g11.t1
MLCHRTSCHQYDKPVGSHATSALARDLWSCAPLVPSWIARKALECPSTGDNLVFRPTALVRQCSTLVSMRL